MILYLSTVALLAASSPNPELTVRARDSLWVAVHVPTKDFAASSLSRMLDIVGEVALRSTDLKVRPLDEHAVRECAEVGRSGAVACMVRAIRRDHEEGRFLLAISTIDERRIVSLLVDLKETDRILQSGAPDLDAEISSTAVVAATLPAELQDEAEVVRYLDELFEKELAPVFEAAGMRTLGQVEIEISTPAWVSMDGKRLGRGAGSVTIRNVPKGRHAFRVEEEGYAPVEVAVDVRPLETARVSAALVSTALTPAEVARATLLYGGLAVAAGGIGLGVAGLVTPGQGCFGGEECPRRFRSSLIPLGYSLLGAGAAWALGAILGDEDAFPWIEILAGAAVFGVSYGLSVGLGGRCAEADGCRVAAR